MTELETKSSYIKTKHFPTKLYEILNFLSRRGKTAELSEIRDKFKNQISKPVIKDIIFDLAMQNFIQEITADKDRRKKIIQLTAEGDSLRQKLEELSKIM
ncbi:MAG: hypothetical protein HWN66_03710 [Candidatus Helarchaeota archaeon]|nr:hypothetical protein [Candidatus Helarchaeota archaeon]